MYLFASTEAIELCKLPVVVQHFFEHKKENPSISWTAFLTMHYLNGSPKDKDYDRDMQLPFKTHTACMGCTLQDFVPLVNHFTIQKSVKILEQKFIVPVDQHFTSSYLAAIWQPPKSA